MSLNKPKSLPTKELLKDVSVIIPTLNEGENLKIILKLLPEEINDLIIVDGNSKDNTREIVQQYKPNAKFIIQKGKGKGNAMIEGVKHAKNNNIIFIDADASMHPIEIYKIAYWLKKGYDVVKGSRFIEGGKSYDITGFRKAGNKILTLIASFVSMNYITDLCYGYFGIKKTVFEQLNIQSDHFGIEAEIFTKTMIKRYKIKEIPSIEYPRIHGDSNLNWWKDGIRILFAILRSLF